MSTLKKVCSSVGDTVVTTTQVVNTFNNTTNQWLIDWSTRVNAGSEARNTEFLEECKVRNILAKKNAAMSLAKSLKEIEQFKQTNDMYEEASDLLDKQMIRVNNLIK